MKALISLLFASFITIYALSAEKVSESEITNSTLKKTENIKLSGRISDKLTGEKLTGVEVQLIGTNEKTYTDFDGNFLFTNVESGAHALKVQYISYREIVENVFVGSSNKPIIIKMESLQK